MKIAVITMWHNEEKLAPFFLSHYGASVTNSAVDMIFLQLDTDTTDNTEKVIEACMPVCGLGIERFTFPEGMDDILKANRINEKMRELEGKYDWVIAVDADELVNPPRWNGDLNDFLASVPLSMNVVMAQLYQVYRHKDDKDLDPAQVPIYQRTHGDPDVWSLFNRCYVKPLCVRPSKSLSWGPGCHNISGGVHLSPECLYGAHWMMADPEIAVERRMSRRARQSKHNLDRGLTKHQHSITEEGIREECGRHENDPDVLRWFLP